MSWLFRKRELGDKVLLSKTTKKNFPLTRLDLALFFPSTSKPKKKKKQEDAPNALFTCLTCASCASGRDSLDEACSDKRKWRDGEEEKTKPSP